MQVFIFLVAAIWGGAVLASLGLGIAALLSPKLRAAFLAG